MAVFAKFEGVDGESKDDHHGRWIDVLNVDWGMQRPSVDSAPLLDVGVPRVRLG